MNLIRWNLDAFSTFGILKWNELIIPKNTCLEELKNYLNWKPRIKIATISVT